jgi:hypothetical protein
MRCPFCFDEVLGFYPLLGILLAIQSACIRMEATLEGNGISH